MAERLRRHGLITGLLRLGLENAPATSVSFDHSFVSVACVIACLEKIPRITRSDASFDGNQVTLTEFAPREPPRNWYGFADVLAELDAWMSSSTHGCWISGSPGSGKSALARVWLAADQLLGYRDDRVLDIKYWSLGRAYPTSFSSVRQELTKGSDGACTLVCLDGLDEIEWSPQELEYICLAAFSTRAKLLVTSREVPRIYPAEFLHLKLRPLGDNEVRLLFQGMGLEEAAVQAIAARAKGSPLFGALVLDALKKGTMSDRDRDTPVKLKATP